MSKYQQFIFSDYSFDPKQRCLTLHYSLDVALEFTETYTFDFEFVDYSPEELDWACQMLFFMAGVSYYKTYLPPEIVVKKGTLDDNTASFISKTWQRGLGEFWYVNQLDPSTQITITANTSQIVTVNNPKTNHGLLIGIGGGKDSLVSVELLRRQFDDLSTWSLNHRPQLTPLIKRIGLPHYWVERQWDHQLLALNKEDALNGHIPISAIIACTGTIVAILSGKSDVIVSNEASANEPTLEYKGVAINHQYSKSQEFEADYQAILRQTLGETIKYYSFLRPLSELEIARTFAKRDFETYHDVFSSCNRAFIDGSDHIFWDGTCPKCAFTFLALTPFIERAKLEALFGGHNLLQDKSLEPTYRQLLGIEGQKPLDCVGETRESRAAMHLAKKDYPELEKYQFELPADYDYTSQSPHLMPQAVYEILTQELARSG